MVGFRAGYFLQGRGEETLLWNLTIRHMSNMPFSVERPSNRDGFARLNMAKFTTTPTQRPGLLPILDLEVDERRIRFATILRSNHVRPSKSVATPPLTFAGHREAVIDGSLGERLIKSTTRNRFFMPIQKAFFK